jgi:membrane protease YdiL (CAAX protease family)
LVFVLVAVVLPGVLLYTAARSRGERNPRLPSALKIRVYYANGALLLGMAAGVAVVWGLSGRALAEIGLRWGAPPYDAVAVGLVLAFVLLYGIDLYREVGDGERQNRTRLSFRRLGFLPATGAEYLHFLFLCVAAGVGEEIVYRGFLITYLSELTGGGGWSAAVSILVPAVSFGLAHLYQGRAAVVKIVAMAVLFGFFFLRSGSLWPLMLLHTAIDATGGLVSWYLERQDRD